LQDPTIVEKYVTTLQEQLNYHKIPEKLRKLQEVIDLGQWTEQHKIEYERLDKIITDSMIHAEKTSCRKFTSTFAWSPQLVKSVQTERFWKLLLKVQRGLPVAPNTITSTKAAAGLEDIAHRPTITEIVDALREAKKTRKELQRKHLDLREAYLDRLAKSLVLKASPQLDDPQNAEKLRIRTKAAVQRIIKKEKRKTMYRSIGSALQPTNMNRGGIARIDVPAVSPGTEETTIDPKTWKGPWRAVTDPDEIGFYVCQMNIKQYNQAEPTPFASGYVASALGDVLTSESASALLEGILTLDPSQIPLQETTQILKFLSTPYPSQMAPCTGQITPEQFIATYKLVHERTSPSFSGRHVGHYKAILENPVLVSIHSIMMSIPY